MTLHWRQFLGPMLGVGAVLLLGATIVAADRLGPWIWAVPTLLVLAVAALSAAFEPVRKAVHAGLASMNDWWGSIGSERSTAASEELRADSVDVSKSEARPLERAEGLLLSLLADGPVKSVDVYGRASEAGISRRTLHRAKTLLGVSVGRVTQGNEGGGYWFWKLSEPFERASAKDIARGARGQGASRSRRRPPA